MDILLSFFSILFLLPIFLLLWIIVRLDSPGPVMYKQRRMKRPNEWFLLHKYRTMQHNARLKQLQGAFPGSLRTRSGKILKDLHIDEIPQLFHVLAGDMSFIGPRPRQYLREEHKFNYYPGYAFRYSVRPGLVGLGHLLEMDGPRFRDWYARTLPHGEEILTATDIADLDMLYARIVSPRTDLILFYSFATFILGQVWKLISHTIKAGKISMPYGEQSEASRRSAQRAHEQRH